MNDAPRIGQRVRFTRSDHRMVRPGTGGMIDQIARDGSQFFVLVDDGGFYGWTTFAAWTPTGESDVVLPLGYLEMRSL